MRAHGEGTIIRRARKRKDGTTVVRWVAVVTRPDGSRQSEWCASPKAAEAARKRLAGLRSVGRLDAAKLTLGDYLERWVADVTLAPATMRQHRFIIANHLVPKLGHHRLDALTPSDVDAYLSRTDLHPQTLRHHRSTLRRALADAVRDGLVRRNVAALSRAPRLRQVERTYLDAAQAARLIEGTKGERIHAPVVMALTTGLRQAELLALAWSDVDLRAPSVTVRHTLQRVSGEWVRMAPKTEKSRRTVTLTPLAVRTLAEHRKAQDAERGTPTVDGLVFTTPSGHPIHGPNLLPPFRAALKRLGLPKDVTWHALRHSTATILLAAGVPLPVISRMLGHSTLRVTADVYGHIVPELERTAAALMDKALRGVAQDRG